MHFQDLQTILKCETLLFSKNRRVENLVIDSRKAVIDETSLFFAVSGKRHDGHLFVNEMYRLGIRQFLVEKDVDVSLLGDSNVLKVESAIGALQSIATDHRNKFSLPIIGITGSNGKTIVKEWLFQALSADLQVVKNPGSYNSQVGVPLSVWQIQKESQLGIFEAGISQPSEMLRLESIIKPTIGVFTNLGSAHDEGFNSNNEKATEKSLLFKNSDVIIYRRDISIIHQSLKNTGRPLLSWGNSKDSDIVVTSLGKRRFSVSYNSKSFILTLPFEDPASQENAFHVMAVMLYMKYAEDIIQDRILQLRSVAMRLELKQGINRCILIDDSYNNDVAGLKISMDFLKNQQKSNKTLILSDVQQSGLTAEKLIDQIKTIVASGSISKFIGIGEVLFNHNKQFGFGLFYKSTSEFLKSMDPESFADEVILLKGARAFQFEKIVHKLQRKVHGTIMEIDMNAMVHNLNYFKSRLKPGTKIMAMVKAFAYGSGSEEVANMLQYHRVDYLGVAYADEGIELRKNNISLAIMVMNPSEESFSAILDYQLEPEIYSLRILKSFVKFLNGTPCKIHLKLDTGMHRLGFQKEELKEALGILKLNTNIKVASVFSHLSGADEKTHDDFSTLQASEFLKMADETETFLGYRPIRHLLNSPGILRLPEFQFDMVRLGIGLYGIDPTAERNTNLMPVPSIKTVISQIKIIKEGETIGYGRKGNADKLMKLATLAIGYADGYSRSFSRGKGKVLIGGKLAPVIGNVCMDMTMVDITGIDAVEGDEAVVFGAGLPIQEVAKWADTIPYEILTSTSERVKRIYYADSL